MAMKIVLFSRIETQRILQDEVPTYFDLNRRKIKNRSSLIIKEINHDILIRSIYGLCVKVMINLTLLVKETIRVKFLLRLSQDFSPLQNPKVDNIYKFIQDVVDYVVNDLFDLITDLGYKNIHIYVRRQLSTLIKTLEFSQMQTIEQFCNQLEQYWNLSIQ